jgi:ribosome-associated heat shock protein Hsp15
MSRQPDKADDETGENGTQRLDKWLWYTRIVKSRTLAATLVSDGKVRLNRQRIDKPSHVVRIGDVVTANIHQRVRVLRVLAAGTRRGPPAEAQGLYQEISEPIPPRTPPAHPAAASARPDKRTRRLLAGLKRQQEPDI